MDGWRRGFFWRGEGGLLNPLAFSQSRSVPFIGQQCHAEGRRTNTGQGVGGGRGGAESVNQAKVKSLNQMLLSKL